MVEHEDSLEEYFLKHPPRSAKHAQAIIAEQTGIRRGLSQVRHFLRDRLGLRWRQTGAIPVPPKKTVEEHIWDQTAFLQEKLEPRLDQARRGRRQVYFVDAAHFVLAPFLGCLWCAARLFMRAASGPKRYNVLGALDAVTHRLVRPCQIPLDDWVFTLQLEAIRNETLENKAVRSAEFPSFDGLDSFQ